MSSPRLVVALVAMLLVVLGMGWAVLAQTGAFAEDRTWTVSTGGEGGTYHALGSTLAEALDATLDHESFTVRTSAGSNENMERIADGTADFAFVQSDAEASDSARAVAALYDELVHLFVRADLTVRVADLGDLTKLDAVSLGPASSGTRHVAEMLLGHFEVDLGDALREVSTADLEPLFAKGELDAALVLAAPGSALVDRLLDAGHVELAPIGRTDGGGAAEAFALLHPEFHSALVPARLYGALPVEPVRTLGVRALLVARAGVPADVVREVAEALDRDRPTLVRAVDTPLRITDPARVGIGLPLHTGARRYYLREEPSFLVEYAEVLSLVITVGVGLWSLASLFMRWRAGLKKERIDVYYARIRDAAPLEPDERLKTLRAIHRRAFEELMAERLSANESFVIFHDYLLSEIARAERHQASAT